MKPTTRLTTRLIVFRYQSASVFVKKTEGSTAKLTNLISKSTGNGHATGVMKKVTDYADRNQVELRLKIGRYHYTDRGMTNEQLVTFYTKHGFEPYDIENKEILMKRSPK